MLGLLMGVSVLSFLEPIEFIIDSIFKVMSNMKEKGFVVPSTGPEIMKTQRKLPFSDNKIFLKNQRFH